jgi:hypothetical protein
VKSSVRSSSRQPCGRVAHYGLEHKVSMSRFQGAVLSGECGVSPEEQPACCKNINRLILADSPEAGSIPQAGGRIPCPAFLCPCRLLRNSETRGTAENPENIADAESLRRANQCLKVHDGKHLAKADRRTGCPLRRSFPRNNPQSKLRSLAKKPSHHRLSAVTRKPAVPMCP